MSYLPQFAHLRSYLASPDPKLRIANAVAFVVAGNQPFYPLYVWWIAPEAAPSSLVTLLSTPFFAAVPFVGRQSALGSKMLLFAAGVSNTVLCTMVLHRSSGVELFYVPCLLLPVILFEGRRRIYATLGASAVVATLLLLVRVAQSSGQSATSGDGLIRLHAFSVAGLVALMAYQVWKEWRSARSEDRAPDRERQR